MDEIYYSKGMKYFRGDSARKDLGKAAWWFRRAANLGNVKSMYFLGEIFLLAEENLMTPYISWFTREDEVYRDVHRAFYWFNRCYEKNSLWGNIDITIREKLRFYGFGLDWNKEDIFEFFLEAIKLPRREEIMYLTGKKYFKGTGGKQKDIGKAIFWFTEAVKHGSSAAACMLGEIYLKGESVNQDIESAVYWYSKTNERGYLKAMYKIGKMYRDGYGVERDLEKACRYFEVVFQNLKWSVL